MFKGIKKRDFYRDFSDRESCLEYLAGIKWADGYVCRKCGHTHYMKGKQPFSRRCRSCRYDESATAHTLFHKLKFCLLKAFEIMFLLTTQKKGASSLSLHEELGLRYATCLGFRRKVQKAMESSGKHPLKPLGGRVEVDETAIGGYDPGSPGRAKGDKKLAAIALEITGKGQFGRAYAQRIDNYSGEQLKEIFDKHISPQAVVRTDQWKGYLPMQEAYKKPVQEPSDKGGNFKELHLHIMNLKNWIRGKHHHLSESYIQRYFDEFHYRFNRRAFRKTIFHKLVQRMVESPITLHAQLKV